MPQDTPVVSLLGKTHRPLKHYKLWLAVLADTGATVAVTLNGLRLLRASTPATAARR